MIHKNSLRERILLLHPKITFLFPSNFLSLRRSFPNRTLYIKTLLKLYLFQFNPFMVVKLLSRSLSLEELRKEVIVLFQSWTAFLRCTIIRGWLLRPHLISSEHLLHLHEQFVILVPHLSPRRRVHPYCLVVTGEILDLKPIKLIDLWPLMRNNRSKSQCEFEHLSASKSTVMT